jgi:hypothetical protein
MFASIALGFATGVSCRFCSRVPVSFITWGSVIGVGRCRQLAAEVVDVTKHPDVGEEVRGAAEEGGADITERPSGRGGAEQRSEVRAGEAQASCRAGSLGEEVEHFVVEVRCAAAYLVPVGAPFVASDRAVSERTAEGKVSGERVVDGGVVPLVPEPV